MPNKLSLAHLPSGSILVAVFNQFINNKRCLTCGHVSHGHNNKGCPMRKCKCSELKTYNKIRRR